MCGTILFALCSMFLPLTSAGNGRIVGGVDAKEGDFPYQVSLRKGRNHFCGGSILNELWILTAAHCVRGQSPEDVSVVAGSNTLKEGGEKFQVAELISHANYSPQTIENDIALIKLKNPIVLDDKMQPVELATEEIEPGTEVVLSGWGTTTYPGMVPNKLQTIKLYSISNEDCNKAHDSTGDITERNICTLTRLGQGACHGDSGGPLVHNKQQVGVVSWGIPCARGKPDVFTKVHSYTTWIKETMGE